MPPHADPVVLLANLVREVTLFGLLIGAVYTDIRYGRILNTLSLPAMGIGFVIAFGLHGFVSPEGGLLDHLLGAMIPVGIFGVPWWLGWFGGGDVKLLAAVGALEGLQFALTALLFTGIAGGVLAGVVLLARRWFASPAGTEVPREGERDRETPAFPRRIPYGVAVATGSAAAWYLSVVG
jgi:prepilin peptidase CpaA